MFGNFDSIEQQWTIKEVIAEGDIVAIRATNTCMQDSFLEIKSGGKQQVFTAKFMHHIVQGKIRQTWRNANDLGRLLQLCDRILTGDTHKM